MQRPVLWAVFVVGFGGIAAQILLLREFLIVFAGTELVIAIILANWLILEALGAFTAGKWVARFPNSVEVFSGLNILFSLMVPVAVYVTRLLKEIWGALPGEGLGLTHVFISSLLVFAPLSYLHGALFTVSCRVYAGTSNSMERALPIGRAYIVETLGTIIGAVAITYLLIPYLSSIQIALAVAAINLLVGLLLIAKLTGRPFHARWHIAVSVAALTATGFLLVTPAAGNIHWRSVERQWRTQNVVHYQNSLHGNIAVTKSNGQYTFMADGLPHITSPDPDLVSLEEFVHLSMLSHPMPESVLVLGGGAGGKLNEILKHPVARVVYTELNPVLLRVVTRFPTPVTALELNDPRVVIEFADGRSYVHRTSERFDMVLVGASNPVSLQTNRLFTAEFFAMVRGRLEPGGILALSLPGSLAYLSRELKNINASVYASLNSAFDHVRVIPGDANLFLASMADLDQLVIPESLSTRLSERGIQAGLINPFYIDFKLESRWTDWFFASLDKASHVPNRDFSPRAMFYGVAHWNELFSPNAAALFARIEHISLKHLAFPLVLVAVVFFLLNLKSRPGAGRAAVVLAIATSGFAGMIFELSLIYAFQTIHGYLFHHIGLLVAAFMTGVAAGGMAVTKSLGSIKNSVRSLMLLEVSMLLLAVVIPAVFLYLTPVMHHPLISYPVFFVLSVKAGFLVGAQFPLASKIILADGGGVSRTAGNLFSADLMGGWFGGLLGGVALLPVLGLFQTGLAIVFVKLTSLSLLVFIRYRPT